MDQHTPHACDTFITENGGSQDGPVNAFSATRYPYTYAYDYIRMCVLDDPGRGGAGQMLKAWCAARNLNEEQRLDMVEVFALRYLRYHGIKV